MWPLIYLLFSSDADMDGLQFWMISDHLRLRLYVQQRKYMYMYTYMAYMYM